MSKIGKQELIIPSGVEFTVNGNTISAKGKEGTITKTFDPNFVEIAVVENKVDLKKKGNGKFASQIWGTWGSHIKSMLKGVETPFTKKLLIEGVGYKWEVKGTELNMSLGYSHPVAYCKSG